MSTHLLPPNEQPRSQGPLSTLGTRLPNENLGARVRIKHLCRTLINSNAFMRLPRMNSQATDTTSREYSALQNLRQWRASTSRQTRTRPAIEAIVNKSPLRKLVVTGSKYMFSVPLCATKVVRYEDGKMPRRGRQWTREALASTVVLPNTKC